MVPSAALCIIEGCDRPRWERWLCRRDYFRCRADGTLNDVALPDSHFDIAVQQGYAVCCDRCRVQLAALAADRGYGDRPLLAGTMTMAEAAAYLLGFFDRRAAAGTERMDPYIVTRFAELRTGRR